MDGRVAARKTQKPSSKSERIVQIFLVLSVAPFGLIGVVAALLSPESRSALLRSWAFLPRWHDRSQFGDPGGQIDTEIAHGRAPWDAVIEATLHRFRPILLTAAAAILGMIPIAATVFWGPMAYSIMGGLAVATMLTLVFLPALSVVWFRIKEPSPGESGRVDPSYQLRETSEA
jgi:multidrug efflux pump